MVTGQRLLLTVIAECVIEERLPADLRHCGVHARTTSRAEGDPLDSRVATAHFGRCKVIADDHPVRVVRQEKFA